MKPRSEFFRNRASYSGLQGACKPCARVRRNAYRADDRPRERRYSLKFRLRDFGLTLEDYDAMLERQHHRCAICLQPERTNHQGTARLMAIDHDHTTGRVRGLLCNDCNRALGLFRDDSAILARGVAYLTRA